MEERDFSEFQDYFVELVDKSLADLREYLLDKLSEAINDFGQIDSANTEFLQNNSSGSKTLGALGDLGSYAVLSSIIPNLNVRTRLPQGIESSVVFRPALRKIGTLAGKTAAAAIFDASAGRLQYGSKQLGASLFADLFSSEN